MPPHGIVERGSPLYSRVLGEKRPRGISAHLSWSIGRQEISGIRGETTASALRQRASGAYFVHPQVSRSPPPFSAQTISRRPDEPPGHQRELRIVLFVDNAATLHGQRDISTHVLVWDVAVCSTPRKDRTRRMHSVGTFLIENGAEEHLRPRCTAWCARCPHLGPHHVLELHQDLRCHIRRPLRHRADCASD